MTQMIFINLPVADVQASTTFYEAVGATKNDTFSDETCSSMVISDTVTAMLLSHDRWRDFTSKQIPDAKKSAQVLLCLSMDSQVACDEAVDAAVKAGGVADPIPKQDHGFMYGRSYEDPDGHIWEAMWMNEAEVKKSMATKD
ncbi:VOC family protein [Roseovarius sp. Pro17]|uniref:VOC family protein n=1 Tax=Roseovarius sp. Pro17 TaxID=3108175 RepID=UPI002D76EBAB|nr:VOC family protein [Roseovarius sp. Pro17]